MHRGLVSSRLIPAAMVGMLWAGAAHAADGLVLVYREAGLAGPAMAFTRADPDLARAVTVRSVRVEAGAWELCARTRFRAPCVHVEESAVTLGRPQGWRGRMQSIRPLAMPEPEPVENQPDAMHR